jgi:hypothetical protein
MGRKKRRFKYPGPKAVNGSPSSVFGFCVASPASAAAGIGTCIKMKLFRESYSIGEVSPSSNTLSQGFGKLEV